MSLNTTSEPSSSVNAVPSTTSPLRDRDRDQLSPIEESPIIKDSISSQPLTLHERADLQLANEPPMPLPKQQYSFNLNNDSNTNPNPNINTNTNTSNSSASTTTTSSNNELLQYDWQSLSDSLDFAHNRYQSDVSNIMVKLEQLDARRSMWMEAAIRMDSVRSTTHFANVENWSIQSSQYINHQQNGLNHSIHSIRNTLRSL
ncbi:hypothetical protein DAPK24_000790 [Pichia kluyveri]|uniref:Biogenesis of lysosome-related organelles complex 1 subunit 1 n=1 Tax=Pichia kluyveri TaxID=36015 RepID=A0AAV5QYL0_PICKL|nr:hypothetical protein DAPK24_000790 [Pichia kluyveri]